MLSIASAGEIETFLWMSVARQKGELTLHWIPFASLRTHFLTISSTVSMSWRYPLNISQIWKSVPRHMVDGIPMHKSCDGLRSVDQRIWPWWTRYCANVTLVKTKEYQSPRGELSHHVGKYVKFHLLQFGYLSLFVTFHLVSYADIVKEVTSLGQGKHIISLGVGTWSIMQYSNSRERSSRCISNRDNWSFEKFIK